MAATTTREPSLVLGADGVAPDRGGAVKPAGTVHVVDGWQPLCGVGRVRFVFPGRAPEQIEDNGCAECLAAVAPVPGTRTRHAS